LVAHKSIYHKPAVSLVALPTMPLNKAPSKKIANRVSAPTKPVAPGSVNKRKSTNPTRNSIVKSETIVQKKRSRSRIPQAEILRRHVLREIKLAGLFPGRKATRLLPFRRIVKDVISKQPNGENLRVEGAAVDMLHEVFEAYAINLFRQTGIVAAQCGRPTVFVSDMTVARTIAESPFDKDGPRTLTWVDKYAIDFDTLRTEAKERNRIEVAEADSSSELSVPETCESLPSDAVYPEKPGFAQPRFVPPRFVSPRIPPTTTTAKSDLPSTADEVEDDEDEDEFEIAEEPSDDEYDEEEDEEEDDIAV
jgi:histone H3/H4